MIKILQTNLLKVFVKSNFIILRHISLDGYKSFFIEKTLKIEFLK